MDQAVSPWIERAVPAGRLRQHCRGADRCDRKCDRGAENKSLQPEVLADHLVLLPPRLPSGARPEATTRSPATHPHPPAGNNSTSFIVPGETRLETPLRTEAELKQPRSIGDELCRSAGTASRPH